MTKTEKYLNTSIGNVASIPNLVMAVGKDKLSVQLTSTDGFSLRVNFNPDHPAHRIGLWLFDRDNAVKSSATTAHFTLRQLIHDALNHGRREVSYAE